MAVSPDDMRGIIDQLRNDFDFILVDSPAGIEQGFQNAIAGANEVIIVTTPEVSAVRDADRIIGLVEAAEKGPAKLVINRIKPAMVRQGDMLSTEDVLEILSVRLYSASSRTTRTSSSRPTAAPPWPITRVAASQAFHNIARRVMGEEVPFLNIGEQQRGILGWLRDLFRSG